MNKNKGFLLILITAFISGGVVFISKFGVSVVNPYIFTGLKNIIVALLVVCWLLMLKDWRVLKELGKRNGSRFWRLDWSAAQFLFFYILKVFQ